MTKHFEDIWNDSEKITQSCNLEPELVKSELFTLVHQLSEDPSKMGRILFLLTYWTNQFGINSYTALLQSMQDAQYTLLSKEPDS